MKIVFLDAMTVGEVPNIGLLKQFGQVIYHQTTRPDEVLDRVKDAAVIVTNKVVLNKDTIEKSHKLKLICIAATGTNNVDKTAAKDHGIEVKNVTDYSTNSVAQGTFALLLHLLNQVNYYDKYVKSGNYSQSPVFTHLGKPFFELAGKRFGIIGLGNIGRKVAGIAEAFGAEVVYYSASGQNNHQPYRRLTLDEILTTSDIVSIHAPLNEYTSNLINYERLRLMKRSAILLNAGRGGIVNESDLAKALDEDLIAAAGIDVFENEPIDPQNPFIHIKKKEKIALTPHVAWASIESRTLLMEKVVQHIREFLNEKELIARI